MIADTAPAKTCTHCGETKPLTAFYTLGAGTAERRARCKACDEARRTHGRRPCANCGGDIPKWRGHGYRYCSRGCVLVGVGLPPDFDIRDLERTWRNAG